MPATLSPTMTAAVAALREHGHLTHYTRGTRSGMLSPSPAGVTHATIRGLIRRGVVTVRSAYIGRDDIEAWGSGAGFLSILVTETTYQLTGADQ